VIALIVREVEKQVNIVQIVTEEDKRIMEKNAMPVMAMVECMNIVTDVAVMEK
jgi:hypothetical protein